jgi:hypothetical protein
LICAMHPYGWQEPLPCPDWCAEADTQSPFELLRADGGETPPGLT